MTLEVLIDRVEASAYTIPTSAPEADGTFAWQETTLVLVEVRAGDQVGLGWTYGSMAIAALVRHTLAPMLTGGRVTAVARLWNQMLGGLRNVGRPGIAAMALSAVDCALWDLKARVLGLPLWQLLGAVRELVPLYGSGGFTSYDRGQLEAQLQHWVADQHLSRVKIKVGESWGAAEDRDLERVAQTRQAIGSDVELYVDANGGYQVGQAVRVARRLDEYDVRWFEEPVSSDDLPGLRQVREHSRADVAAGEYGYSLDYFHRLCAAEAVDCVQVDVTRCGGITELLRIAAVAAGAHREISGHCAPYQHAAVLASVPNLRHLEYFWDHARIEERFFDGVPPISQGGLSLSESPGTGLSWRTETASPFRTF